MIFLKLFLTFFKIGLFTFGGGYAMLPLIQQEVLNNGWLTVSEMMDFIAIAESTPGPFAINIATFVGFSQGGIPGALCSTLGVVMPSFIVILIIVRIIDKFNNSKVVKGAMIGLKGAVVGLIGVAVITAIKAAIDAITLTPFEIIVATAIFLFSMIGLKKKIHPALIILVAALVGIVIKGAIL